MIRAAFFFYLLALLIAPLAFGSVETWSLTFMESAVFSAAVLFLVGRYHDHRRPLREAPGLIYLLLLPGFFLVQLLPMPGPVLKLISPAAVNIYESTIGLASPPGWLTITLHKKATLAEFFRFSAYCAIYFLTIQFTARRQRLLATIYLIVATGTFIALVAIIQKVTADGLIYWFRPSPGSTPMGPYVYRNQFAGYIGMIFPLTLGLFLWTKPVATGLRTFRQRFIGFFNRPGVNSHTLFGVAATIMATSVFFSLSRGGIISLCLALLFMLFILNRSNHLSGQRLLFILVPTVTLVFVGWFGWEPIIERFLKIRTAVGIHDGRLLIWQDTLPMIRDFLLTGSGAGSFATLFPTYQTIGFGDKIVDHAHNDYLELLSTTGLIGVLLVGGFLGVVIQKSGRMIGRRKDLFAVYLWAACLTGMISIFLHGVTDFNFYNGANGLYFFTICGLMVSGSATRLQARMRSLLPIVRITRARLLVATIAAIVMLLAGLFVNIRAMQAAGHFNAVRNISLNTNIPEGKLLAMGRRAALAVRLDPLAARHFYLQANIESFLPDSGAAAASYRRALELHPLNGEYLQRYGVFLGTSQDGFNPEPLLRAATIVNPVDPAVHLRYGNWLLDQQEFARGFRQMKVGLTLNPRQLTSQLALLTVYGFRGEELQQILPDGFGYRLTLARFLEQLNQLEEATEIVRQAEFMLASDRGMAARDYQTVARYYSRQKMIEDALRVARRGVDRFPANGQNWLMLGDLLSRNGLQIEAEAAIRKAVGLNPSDLLPRLKLASFLAGNDFAVEAEREYRQLVRIMAQAGDLSSWHIRSIYNYYYRKDDYEMALTVINNGIKALPGTSGVRLILGDAYLQMGRKVDARVEYQRILARDPGNNEARQRLKKMAVPH